MTDDTTDDPESYVLPTHDSGQMLITDWRALSDMLDDEDVERALRFCGSDAMSAPRAILDR